MLSGAGFAGRAAWGGNGHEGTTTTKEEEKVRVEPWGWRRSQGPVSMEYNELNEAARAHEFPYS